MNKCCCGPTNNTDSCYAPCVQAAVLLQLYTAPNHVPSVTITGSTISVASFAAGGTTVLSDSNDSFACPTSPCASAQNFLIKSGTGSSWQGWYGGKTSPSFTSATGYTSCPPMDDYNSTGSAWTRIPNSPTSPVTGWNASESMVTRLYGFSTLLGLPDTTQTLFVDLVINNFTGSGYIYTAAPVNPVWDGTLVCTATGTFPNTQTWQANPGATPVSVLASAGLYIDGYYPSLTYQQGPPGGLACDQYNVSFGMGNPDPPQTSQFPSYGRPGPGSPFGYLPFTSLNSTNSFTGPLNILISYFTVGAGDGFGMGFGL